MEIDADMVEMQLNNTEVKKHMTALAVLQALSQNLKMSCFCPVMQGSL